MMRTTIAATLCALALTAIAGAAADEKAPPGTPSPWLIGRRGVVTPEGAALAGIAFRPFVPTRRYKEVALLAPFHGSDVRANRGIGYEYEQHGRLYALSQWPANGGSLRAFRALKGEERCADVHAFGNEAKPRGIVWSTPRGFVLTLQPDGESDARTLLAEWRRLIRRGACR